MFTFSLLFLLHSRLERVRWLTCIGVGYWGKIWTYGNLYREFVWVVVVEVCRVSVEGEASGVGEVCGSIGGEAEF